MDNSIEYFNNFLKHELATHMKSNGFKKSGQHFYIETEDFIKYISVTKSSWNMKDNFTFWFQTSIFDKISYKYLKEYIVIQKIPHNTLLNIIQTKVINHNPKSGTKSSYTIDKTTDIQEFNNIIFDHLDNYLIPYIKSYQTKTDLLNIYKKPPSGYIGPGVLLDLCIGLHEIEYGDKNKGYNYISNWIIKERKRGYGNNLVDAFEEKINKNEL